MVVYLSPYFTFSDISKSYFTFSVLWKIIFWSHVLAPPPPPLPPPPPTNRREYLHWFLSPMKTEPILPGKVYYDIIITNIKDRCHMHIVDRQKPKLAYFHSKYSWPMLPAHHDHMIIKQYANDTAWWRFNNDICQHIDHIWGISGSLYFKEW